MMNASSFVEHIMIQGNGEPSRSGRVPDSNLAERLLHLAVDRMVMRMALGDVSHRAIADEVAGWSRRQGDEIPASVFQEDDPDVAAVEWLIAKMGTIESSLGSAGLHRVIQLLTLEGSFHAAVERSARRQVYQLAYGLTHEINNPLANIVARAQRLMGDVSDTAAKKSLATIMDQGMRAHEMLAEAMRAVQPPTHERVATDIVSIVREVGSDLHERARQKGVRWECNPSTDRIFAEVHRPSLTDALRMLGLNAIDVCGPKDSVIWECATIDGREGRRVRLTLSDTGPGLTPQAQRSATDLYYSGREHGRGLGVSLAMVQRVIEMHQGTFALRSEFGAGCRVEIELPATDAPIASRPTLNL